MSGPPSLVPIGPSSTSKTTPPPSLIPVDPVPVGSINSFVPSALTPVTSATPSTSTLGKTTNTSSGPVIDLSEYISANTWESTGLSAPTIKALRKMGFDRPSKIQVQAIPSIISNDHPNVIAQAKSGSGKTVAFGSSIVHRINVNEKLPQALILVNSRELARQIYDILGQITVLTEIKTQLIVPQENIPAVIDAQIVVGTPGKMFSTVSNFALNTSFVKVFVLDEADAMIAKNTNIATHVLGIFNELPDDVQVLLFSATYPKDVLLLAQQLTNNDAQLIKAAAGNEKKQNFVSGINEFFIQCDSSWDRIRVVSELYDVLTHGQSMIFVATRKAARALSEELIGKGYNVALLTGGEMTPDERDTVIDQFRENKIKVLITTNVLARGLDILTVNLVINYDLPVSKHGAIDNETYVHRVGRTGRFGKQGFAISLCHDDFSRNALADITKFTGKSITEVSSVEEFELLLQTQHNL